MLTPQPEGRFLAPGLTSSSVAPQCLHCQGLLGLTPAPPSFSLLANLPQVNTVRKKSRLSLQRCCAHFPECRGTWMHIRATTCPYPRDDPFPVIPGAPWTSTRRHMYLLAPGVGPPEGQSHVVPVSSASITGCPIGGHSPFTGRLNVHVRSFFMSISKLNVLLCPCYFGCQDFSLWSLPSSTCLRRWDREKWPPLLSSPT